MFQLSCCWFAAYLLYQFCHNTKKVVFAPTPVALQLPDQDLKIHVPLIQQFSFDYLIWGHNHINASLALAAINYYQESNKVISATDYKKTIESFRWLERRVEFLWKNIHWISLFSDYWHHPEEIKSTISSFKETYPNTSLTCIFEAHQARRLISFWDEFIAAFSWVSCYMVPIYTARESVEELSAYSKQLPDL